MEANSGSRLQRVAPMPEDSLAIREFSVGGALRAAARRGPWLGQPGGGVRTERRGQVQLARPATRAVRLRHRARHAGAVRRTAPTMAIEHAQSCLAPRLPARDRPGNWESITCRPFKTGTARTARCGGRCPAVQHSDDANAFVKTGLARRGHRAWRAVRGARPCSGSWSGPSPSRRRTCRPRHWVSGPAHTDSPLRP